MENVDYSHARNAKSDTFFYNIMIIHMFWHFRSEILLLENCYWIRRENRRLVGQSLPTINLT